MALLRSVRGLSLSFCVLGLVACSLLGGESSDDENGGGDGCTEGETKSCKGANACQGVSICDADGNMGKCVCGGGGTGGAGGGTGCASLQTCCNSSAFPESARATCLQVVDFGDGPTCTAAVDQYRAAGLCGSAGVGGTSAGTGGVSGTGGISGGASGTTGIGGTSAGTGAGGISGASGTGGGVAGSSSGTGGSGGEPTCGASFHALAGGYVTAPGTSGCWHGYAFIALSSGSTSTPTDFVACADPCGLCASGSVAATTDYSGYSMIGMNLSQGTDGTTTATVTPAGTSLVVNFTNSVASPLRIQILGANGDTVATERWCATLPTTASGPVTIPYTSFNTECWEGGAGVAYARQPIKAVQLLVPGGNVTSIPYNMCLTSVADQ